MVYLYVFGKQHRNACWAALVVGLSKGTPKNSAAAQQDDPSLLQTTILVIDDDEAVRSLLCETLNLHGYKVIAAATAQEADTALKQLGAAAIGLVIADIQLTSDSQAREGYELYERWTITLSSFLTAVQTLLGG
jgi:PleD family two-component response regulator